MGDLTPRRNAGLWFRLAMGSLLILGAAAWIISPARWESNAASWSGAVIWAVALAWCALLLWLISYAGDLLRALAAMWRPLLLVLAAAYLLFANDQGRELGVGLMAETKWWRFFALFFVLIYWAANNWHTARLGLRAVFSAPTGDEKWLFWPPRLIGVCAHLFAAINLSLAAANQPDLVANGQWPLAWTAPFAIGCATALAWTLDHFLLSERTSAKRRLTKICAVVVALVLLGNIAIVALGVPSAPPGFSRGTIWISASAVVFLLSISLLHHRKPFGPGAPAAVREAENREIFIFTAVLFLMAFGFACATWINPNAVGGCLGSMVVAYFAFGAILALVNAFELAVVWTARRWAGPRVVAAYAVVFLIGIAVINAWLHPFHRIRLCDGDCVVPPSAKGFTVATSPDQRPTVAAAARAWYEQAKAAYGGAKGKGPVPMLIVATAGGGIRAAYWTATVLERLDRDLRAKGGVRPYLFAISGVSGGSVGAVAFDAALAQRDESGCTAGDTRCPLATSFLTADFLAPALASLVFVDAPASFLPDFGQGDRGTALEKSFEIASGGLLTRPFLSLFPYKKDPAAKGLAPWRPILLLNATHEETGKRIITGHVLIERDVFIDSLDALHELRTDVRASTAAHNSARFTYISPAGDLGNDRGWVIDGGYFENYGALSALELARAARAALGRDKVKLVILMISSDPDLQKARELVRINEAKYGGKCLVSVAERDATADPGGPNYLSIDKEQVENAWINEFLAPFQGVKNVREAHGNRAAAELALEICSEYPEPRKSPSSSAPESQSPAASSAPDTQTAVTLAKAKNENVNDWPPVRTSQKNPYFANLAMCKEGRPAPVRPPLGWVLSQATQKAFEDLLDECGNDHELSQLEIALGRPMPQHQAARR